MRAERAGGVDRPSARKRTPLNSAIWLWISIHWDQPQRMVRKLGMSGTIQGLPVESGEDRFCRNAEGRDGAEGAAEVGRGALRVLFEFWGSEDAAFGVGRDEAGGNGWGRRERGGVGVCVFLEKEQKRAKKGLRKFWGV